MGASVARDALGVGTAVVVLASGSPRRLALLEQLGLSPRVLPADIDESPLPSEDPVAYVRRLAAEKAAAVTADVPADAIVVAADTTVDLEGEILAKPVDIDDARRMLRRLSGRTHRVHTGVAVRRGSVVLVEVVTTLVTFVPMSDDVREWYLATGEPLDKAGAYALQGAGGVLVDQVAGSVSNVVGLPLATLAELLRRLAVSPG
jgi:septum formation protein